ncbi:RraA family protein [Amycolatopsis japonica]
MTEKNLLVRLRALDTCAVSDALDRHGLPGVLHGLRPLAAPGTVAGAAVTVLLTRADKAVTSARHLGTAAVMSAGPDNVIVVAHQGRTDCAGWGGLLSRAAAARGVAGVLVDGAARDLSEAADVGLGVYARSATPVTARGRAVEQEWGEPVDLAGIVVTPGDLILADAGGAVVISARHAADVIATAEQIAATEQAMAKAIASGTPVTEVMGKTYEQLTEQGR